MNPILELQRVSKCFSHRGKPPVKAVQEVSACIYPGEILGLVGQSGCGKSTLARLAACLLAPTSGSIFLDGREVTEAKGKALREVHRQVQMVFQHPTASFDPRRTLGDGIGESLRNLGYTKRERERRVEELLERCGLGAEYARRYPHQVSGGECQRAALARALASKPRLILLDEPTSALDVWTQKQILELLAQLQGQEGLSYLLISHNLALMERVCHRVLVMDQGQVVEEGSPAQVLGKPASPAAQRLADAAIPWDLSDPVPPCLP